MAAHIFSIVNLVALAGWLSLAVFPRRRWAEQLGTWVIPALLAGAFIGGVMTRPTQPQMAEMRAGRATVSGAHTVGGEDGGPGLAVVGWSREHGDVRAAHFLGLHALQVLPLLALGLRRSRANREQQVRLVFTAAASYVGLVGLVLWQALRGQSLIAPDSATLVALLLWLGLTVAFALRSVATGPRHERPKREALRGHAKDSAGEVLACPPSSAG
jgi:hypothetical protein